jgi:hypothetical protein
MEKLYLKLYDLENYIFTDARANFFGNGFLEAFDFFCIVIWKANRAKSNVSNKLLNYNPDLDQSVKNLTGRIFQAKEDREKLRILIKDFEFRLPMASAILSVLYPETFTIYDIRVCETFPDYKNIQSLNFEKLWNNYSDYILSVKNYGDGNLSLRDTDRFLWGKSFSDQLKSDITKKFKKNNLQ